MTLVIGVPICEKKAYIWGKFIENMQQLMQRCPGSRLVFAVRDTPEDRIFAEKYRLNDNGKVIYYSPEIPPSKQEWLYNIAAARETLRKYSLDKKADYLFMADCDMTFEHDTLPKLIDQIRGNDIVMSAAGVRGFTTWSLRDSSPVLFKGSILKKFHYRCKWYAPKRFICENEMLDYDLFLVGAKIKKGAFITNSHYFDKDTRNELVAPFRIPLSRKIEYSNSFRFVIFNLGRLFHMSFSWPVHKVVHIWLKIP